MEIKKKLHDVLFLNVCVLITLVILLLALGAAYSIVGKDILSLEAKSKFERNIQANDNIKQLRNIAITQHKMAASLSELVSKMGSVIITFLVIFIILSGYHIFATRKVLRSLNDID